MTSLSTSYWRAEPAPYDLAVTVGGALRASAAAWPERPALIEGTRDDSARAWTFAELLADAERTARAMLTRVRPGDHLAVWATNRPEWLMLEFGAALAGVILVTVNPAFGAAEAEFVLRKSRARALIVEPEVRGRDLVSIAERLQAQNAELTDVVSLEDWDEFLLSAARAPLGELPEVSPTHPAQIQFTSGTTGFPKGALLAHRGLALDAHMYADRIGSTPADVWINPMPLFHTAGCGLATLGALQTGAAQVLPPTFDPDLVLDLIEHHHASIMLAVPTMLIRLLETQAARPRRISSWRLATLGGAPVPTELVHRAESELHLSVGIGFGQTEASPYITHTFPDDPNPQWAETVGRPLPLVEVKIADVATGRPTPIATAGEICTRSICLMHEYFDDAAATADTIDPQGWLHTGDVGTMDENGYLRVQGRLKEMIIRGGENIYPREIEDILFSHPAVSNVAVIGIPDGEWGELVAAFVQLDADRAPLDEPAQIEDLQQFCRAHLARFKVPSIWRFVDTLPQTSSGKIQKFELRKHYADDGTA